MTDQELMEKTRQVMYGNMVQGQLRDGREYHYTKPSTGRYPYQFFWDTCFHVFILSALGEYTMAKRHLESLFSMQREDGFVGHMIYWDRLKPGRLTDFFQSLPRWENLCQSHMSALVQPPLAALAVKRLYQATRERSFLQEMVPQLKRYYRWLATHRDLDGDGLLTIISPFESGMDWKPTFDTALGFRPGKADWKLFWKVVRVDMTNFLHRYDLQVIREKGHFLVKEVGFNAVYAQNLQVLADLCHEAGDPEGHLFSWLGNQVADSLLKVMYDDADAAFYDVYGSENRKVRRLTPTIFYPAVMENMPDAVVEHVIKKHFFNEREFGAAYPISSVAKNDPAFNPAESIYIWRGPTWVISNWFLYPFLLRRGYDQEARHLMDSVRSLIARSGFREYYHPQTGEGYGAREFTWAGLVVDMMQMEHTVNTAG